MEELKEVKRQTQSQSDVQNASFISTDKLREIEQQQEEMAGQVQDIKSAAEQIKKEAALQKTEIENQGRAITESQRNLTRLDELIKVFTNLKAKVLQDHEPRIAELETLNREL